MFINVVEGLMFMTFYLGNFHLDVYFMKFYK